MHLIADKSQQSKNHFGSSSQTLSSGENLNDLGKILVSVSRSLQLKNGAFSHQNKQKCCTCL